MGVEREQALYVCALLRDLAALPAEMEPYLHAPTLRAYAYALEGSLDAMPRGVLGHPPTWRAAQEVHREIFQREGLRPVLG